MYGKSICLVCLSILLSTKGWSQLSVVQARDTIYQIISNYHGDSGLSKIDSSGFVWHLADTLEHGGQTSAIRTFPKWDTLKIQLSFEEDWGRERIRSVGDKNSGLISKLKCRYLEYMDSINWRGFKISRSSFESDVVGHLKMKYPVKFSKQECIEIAEIERCPDFLVGEVGVFLTCDHAGIDPEEVRAEYIERLRFISESIFGVQRINYGRRKLYK